MYVGNKEKFPRTAWKQKLYWFKKRSRCDCEKSWALDLLDSAHKMCSRIFNSRLNIQYVIANIISEEQLV